MSEGSGKKSPKTLADVSHLFFSNAEERQPTKPSEAPDGVASGAAEPLGGAALPSREIGTTSPPARSDRRRTTRVFVVTGSDGGPGKSTVAANLAQALLRHGSVGLYDADPCVPNARFYLGFPSWDYLSPITGEGAQAPAAVSASGLVVVDWSAGGPSTGVALPDSVSVQVPDAGTYELDYAVVDAPLSRAVPLCAGRGATPFFVVVAEPGLAGFERAFAALARLARDAGAREAGVVVNRVPSLSYAKAFCAKMRLAANRLLSMEARFLGGVIGESNLGAEQRERGVLVKSRPDAAAALMLKEVAANALSLSVAAVEPVDRQMAPAGTENRDETEDRTIAAS
jgi:MinD-like ATPase involved in chromosome partitioning or flagellar assembly